MPLTEMPLAEIRDLAVRFVTREATVHAVNGVTFAVNPGEVLCILGELGLGQERHIARLDAPPAAAAHANRGRGEH